MFHKTSSGKWKKKMRKCCPVVTNNQIFGSWECQYECVCVCVCVCLSVLLGCVISAFTLIFSMAENIHVCQLYLWCVLETRRDHGGSGLKAGPGSLGTLALLCSSVPILVGAVCPSCVLPGVQNFGQKSREVFFRIVQALLWELLE